ncbi:hypothetical protein H2203_002135 [Taxawa tesnikishii (nom. ined.)]|nr:hypothetical protein H2203_002135 [Dothideales sp. JES 119]
MASAKSCLSHISRSALTPSLRPVAQLPPPFLLPFQQHRTAVQSANAAKYKRKDQPTSTRKKKSRTTFIQYDLKDAIQFSLVDAMRRPLAQQLEIRTPPQTSHTQERRRGPESPASPHPVKTDLRIAVVAPEDSAAAAAARKAGATLVGEDSIFTAVKAGRIEFDRCICHTDSLAKLNKAGLGRVLGPRGLMPSAKTGTVVKDVGASVRDMVGASEYRERLGVVRMAVGQLGYTPEELQRNIRAFVEKVLSSTNGPGLSLNGDFKGPNSVPTKDLSTL